jgi:hypothetical protein
MSSGALIPQNTRKEVEDGKNHMADYENYSGYR